VLGILLARVGSEVGGCKELWNIISLTRNCFSFSTSQISFQNENKIKMPQEYYY